MSVDAGAYLFAALAVTGGVLAVTLRNMLHAIFGLALSLLGVAALFLYLGNPFVAAMEVLIYIGGISVAMAFAVMFAYSIGEATPRLYARRVLGSIAVGAALFIPLAMIFSKVEAASSAGGGDGSIAAIGRALLIRYALPFETLSVVLLLAIIGAIIIARKEPSEEEEREREPRPGQVAEEDRPR